MANGPRPKTAKTQRRNIRDWPLGWPLSIGCTHPSTGGMRVEQEDGSRRDEDVTCLRRGRALPSKEIARG